MEVYLMDSFAEQIVLKKLTGNQYLAKTTIIILTILLTLAVTVFSIYYLPLCLLVIFPIIYLGYTLYNNFYVEYEYAITNGEIDIDKVIAKKKRSRLLTVKVSSFESFGKYQNAPEVDSEVTTILVSDFEDNNEYYADFNHSDYGKARLIFSPNEKFISCMNSFLPRKLK
jgi:hypothetical protein